MSQTAVHESAIMERLVLSPEKAEAIASLSFAREDQERIFHEFVQLGKTQLQDGTGLGLPISRRLAELLRGSLTVESTVGEGSTFCLSLPQSAESAPPRVRVPEHVLHLLERHATA